MSTGTVKYTALLLHRLKESTAHFWMPRRWPKWLPPHGFTCKVHHLDAKVGGTYKMSFTHFTKGFVRSFGGNISR